MTRTIESKLVKDDEQGSFFSGVSFVQGLCKITGAVGVNFLYSQTVLVYLYHSFIIVFFVLFCIQSVVLVLTIIAHILLRKRERSMSIAVIQEAVSPIST